MGVISLYLFTVLFSSVNMEPPISHHMPMQSEGGRNIGKTGLPPHNNQKAGQDTTIKHSEASTISKWEGEMRGHGKIRTWRYVFEGGTVSVYYGQKDQCYRRLWFIHPIAFHIKNNSHNGR